MDLLRNLGSAAASTLLHKSGISLPYTLGERVTEYDGKSIWTLYDAIKKDDSSPVSVFHFDNASSSNIFPQFPANAVKKLRTTRHPDVLKYIDLVEQGGSYWIMTERVRPLRGALFSWGDGAEGAAVGKGKGKNKSREEWTIWGLHRIAVALTFLNNACASTHGNLTIDSIFLSPSGEWRLGGFELLSSTKDERPVLFSHGQQYPYLNDISSPEVKKEGYKALHDLPPGVADAYSLAILINTVFNLTTTPPSTTQPPHQPLPASARGGIPLTIFPLVKKLFNPSPKMRMTSQAFLEIGMGERAGVEGVSGRFFVDNHLVAVCSKLESFPLASDGEKAEFLRALKESASSFPPEFSINRLIPALLSSLEHGGASAAAVLPLIFELAKIAEGDPKSTSLSSSRRAYTLDPAEYTTRIIKPIVKLFPSPDRGTRMALLEALPEYEGKLDARTVQDGIWPHLQTGFADTVPVIREATVRAISLLATKLSSRVLNNDLLRHLAKAQSDAEPSIRTNTCILIARIAPTLSDNTKKKVLVPAFSKAIKDPFVHARVAGMTGLMASIDCFEVEDAATRILGVIGGGMVDKEKLVRDQAFKCLDVYRTKIEAYAANMPETVIPPEGVPGGLNGATPNANPAQADYVSTATGAAGAIAGWAFSSISSRLVSSDLATTMVPTNQLAPPSGASTPTLSPSSPSASTTQPATARSSIVAAAERRVAGSSSASGSKPTKSKGMSLGSKLGHKGGLSNGHAALMAELENEMKSEEVEVADAWDNDTPYGEEAEKSPADGDLMDVNADQDDWSAFESAPAVSAPVDAATSAWGVQLQSPAISVAPTNPWQESADDLASAFTKPSAYSSLSTQSTLQPKSLSSTTATSATSMSGKSTPSGGMSSVLSTWQSPITSPKPTDDWGGFGDGEMVAVDEMKAARSDSPASAGLAGMSKEDKAAEMARRREERKARIAQLKEQKKGGA